MKALGSKTYTRKSGLMTIRINIKAKKFLRETPWQNNRTTLKILILKVSVTLKKSGKRSNLISVTYSYLKREGL